jgi:hypothetical protein
MNIGQLIAPCKHSELDPLPTWLLKQCSHALAPFLTALFNLSIASATFPVKHEVCDSRAFAEIDNLNVDELKK